MFRALSAVRKNRETLSFMVIKIHTDSRIHEIMY